MLDLQQEMMLIRTMSLNQNSKAVGHKTKTTSLKPPKRAVELEETVGRV